MMPLRWNKSKVKLYCLDNIERKIRRKNWKRKSKRQDGTKSCVNLHKVKKITVKKIIKTFKN
jgi:hypothetical protein